MGVPASPLVRPARNSLPYSQVSRLQVQPGGDGSGGGGCGASHKSKTGQHAAPPPSPSPNRCAPPLGPRTDAPLSRPEPPRRSSRRSGVEEPVTACSRSGSLNARQRTAITTPTTATPAIRRLVRQLPGVQAARQTQGVQLQVAMRLLKGVQDWRPRQRLQRQLRKRRRLRQQRAAATTQTAMPTAAAAWTLHTRQRRQLTADMRQQQLTDPSPLTTCSKSTHPA